MKQLIVYHNESHQKYNQLYNSYTFEIDDLGILRIFKLSKVTGIPSLIAGYKEWTYFSIEEEPE